MNIFYLKRCQTIKEQGRKRPLDTPKRILERKKREGERKRKVQGEI